MESESIMVGILDAILGFSKGREPTLLPRVPLQWACSEERGCLKPSLGETQRGALQRSKKPAYVFCGELCAVFTLVSLVNYTLPERNVDCQEKKQRLKYQSWHVFFLKNT